MTNSIAEMEEAECILVIGLQHHRDPSGHRHLYQAGGASEQQNPHRYRSAPHRPGASPTMWLRHRPGTDIAVINGLMHLIIQENLHDQAYIAERTENFEALRESVAKYTPEYVEEISGVPAADLRRAARLYGAGQGRSHRLCHGHHPAYRGHRQRQDPWPTCPCSAATSALKAAGSIPSGARTTSRGPATWAACPTSFPATSR